MMVYCENCKWYPDFISKCLDAQKYDEDNYKPGEIIKDETIRKAANSNYDCYFYERKWWKFWA